MVTLAILFGLSMDYQVFLVSRMNEEWVHTHGNAAAVRTGQTETGRVITAAATIMICVFLTFSFMGQRDVAEFGIGLACGRGRAGHVLPSCVPCWSRRRCTYSGTPTGGCLAGSTGVSPT